MWAHKSNTVFLSISAASLSAVFIYEYSSTNSLILSTKLQYSIYFEKFSLDIYESEIKICIKTETGIFSLINFSICYITSSAIFPFFSKYWRVLGVWTIFASIALLKSKQKTFIFSLADL